MKHLFVCLWKKNVAFSLMATSFEKKKKTQVLFRMVLTLICSAKVWYKKLLIFFFCKMLSALPIQNEILEQNSFNISTCSSLHFSYSSSILISFRNGTDVVKFSKNALKRNCELTLKTNYVLNWENYPCLHLLKN